MEVAVVIPALNEEESIGNVIRAIPRNTVSEIIVVDNGSADATAKAAREAGATVLVEPRKGYGRACLCGIGHALLRNPDVIVFLDGDFSDYPEELPSILGPIAEEGCDLVIGSRMLGVREPGAMLPQALIGNAIAVFLIRLLWGTTFTDLGPFRAVRTDVLRRMAMSEPTFGWTIEMQIKAAKLGLSVKEVPVRYRKRIGRSKVTGTLKGTLLASARILATIIRFLFVQMEPVNRGNNEP